MLGAVTEATFLLPGSRITKPKQVRDTPALKLLLKGALVPWMSAGWE